MGILTRRLMLISSLDGRLWSGGGWRGKGREKCCEYPVVLVRGIRLSEQCLVSIIQGLQVTVHPCQTSTYRCSIVAQQPGCTILKLI
jgi:hypothetical protein